MSANPNERTPGVYVRAENDPHELDMLWATPKHLHREERSPVIPFIGGALAGALVTAGVFMLFINPPRIDLGGAGEAVAPITEELAPAVPNTAKTNPKQADRQIPRKYTVQNGDTLSGIAGKMYNNSSPTMVKKIMRANNMSSPDRLQIGQKLVIPPKDY